MSGDAKGQEGIGIKQGLGIMGEDGEMNSKSQQCNSSIGSLPCSVSHSLTASRRDLVRSCLNAGVRRGRGEPTPSSPGYKAPLVTFGELKQ